VLEGQVAGEELERHHAERVDVGAVVERHLAHLLRRHVGGRADAGDLRGLACRVQRGTEIGDADVAAAGDHQQDVGGLDVAVGDALVEGVVERACGLEDDLDDALEGRQRRRRRDVLERAARHVVHDQPGILVGDQRVMDAHDVRVVQLAGERSLVEEELAQQAPALWIGEDLAAQALDRHLDLAEGVPGEVDAARGAHADAAEDLVLADAFGRRCAHGRRAGISPGRGGRAPPRHAPARARCRRRACARRANPRR